MRNLIRVLSSYEISYVQPEIGAYYKSKDTIVKIIGTHKIQASWTDLVYDCLTVNGKVFDFYKFSAFHEDIKKISKLEGLFAVGE